METCGMQQLTLVCEEHFGKKINEQGVYQIDINLYTTAMN